MGGGKGKLCCTQSVQENFMTTPSCSKFKGLWWISSKLTGECEKQSISDTILGSLNLGTSIMKRSKFED